MRTIHLRYHYEHGSWWADSRDIEGFSAAGDTFNDVRELAHEGVDFALEGEAHVIVEEASMMNDTPSSNPVEAPVSDLALVG